MTDDPCNCRATCVHGQRCIGGHADRPDWHLFHCDTCSPPTAVGRLRSDGGVDWVIRACGHTVSAATASEGTKALRAHTCA